MAVIANLFINLLIVALLMVTIGYCWILNKRIRILQDSKGELAELLGHFDESTQRASDSIIALQTASKKIGDTIQSRIERANYLADDLTFLIEKAGKLANQLEAEQAVSRARTRANAEPLAVLAANEMVEAEKPREKAAPAKEKTNAALESMLERIIGRAKNPAKDVAPKLEAEARPAGSKAGSARSRAEQELLEIIRAGMKG